MESYVERWTREQKEKKAAAEKKTQKKAQKVKNTQKEVTQNVEDSRGEGHEAQKAAGR